MWQVSAEIKELNGAEYGGKYPEKNQISLRDVECIMQQIKNNSGNNKLPPAQVLKNKPQVPAYKISFVVVRVGCGGNMFMMQMVFRQYAVVGQGRIKQKRKAANCSVYFFISAHRTMHGIVCRNK